MSRKAYFVASLLVSCAAAATQPAHAQETEVSSVPDARQSNSVGLDDIVVTARKRDETLISVPVAVTAISSADLQRSGAVRLEQIGELAPQVTLTKGYTGSGATFSVRGLSSSFLDAGIEQTVSVNINGVAIGRGHISALGMFDIGQVEILKGPQALFFGKNSPAGVVSITTQAPTDELSGYVRAGYEFNADELYGEAAVSGPLSDTLNARLAVRGAGMDGYIYNRAKSMPYFLDPTTSTGVLSHPRQPRTREFLGRLSLDWRPSSSFSAELRLSGGTYEDNGSSGTLQTVCANSNGQSTVLGMVDPYDDCKFDRNRAVGAYPRKFIENWPYMSKTGESETEQKTALASLKMEYTAPEFSITSVTGYYHIDWRRVDGSESSSFAVIHGAFFEKNNTFTQELRAATSFDGPLNFTVGAYYEAADYSTGGAHDSSTGGKFQDPATGRWFTALRDADNKNRAYSLFGQARWNIVPQLELAAGVRWTSETKRVKQQNLYVNPALPPAFAAAFVAPGTILDSRISENNWSPEATLTWRPTDELTIYGSYKTGYKSGGVSNPTTLRSAYTGPGLEFAPETVEGFEGGIKGYLFDRRARVELSVYNYNYDDLQASSFDAVQLTYLIKNVAAARIRGIELDSEFRVMPGLTLRGSVGYNHARYSSYPNGACGQRLDCVGGTTVDLTGQQLVRAPDWSGSICAKFDTAISPGLRLGLNADMSFSSSYFLQENNDPRSRQGAFQKLNAGFRIYSEDDSWELAIIGRNLTNELIRTLSVDKPFAGNGTFIVGAGRPRQITVQGTIRF